MTARAWKAVLSEARALHKGSAALSAFCAFPEVTYTADIAPFTDPLCEIMQADQSCAVTPFPAFREACFAAARHAWWRDTYRESTIGAVLHAHFGTFEILGRDTPLKAGGMRGFLIYQRAGYHYPLHHHPAEELYLVIAGEGVFEIEGQPPQRLGPGDTAFHASNVPHALTTETSAILAYVVWRGDITTKPVFTYPERLS